VTGSEPAPTAWYKSKASGSGGSDCVEVAFTDKSVFVRHSQNPTGPVLAFSYSEWRAFLSGACDGEFDLPEDGAGVSLR
jgi:Domain of unknown function (DUF397)